MYVSLIYEETSFVHLRKFRTLWAVSAKYVRLHILGNEVESSQNTLHYIQNRFLFWYFREWILNGQSVSYRTLLGGFLLAQKFIEQRLTHNKMMGAKLHPVADPNMI